MRLAAALAASSALGACARRDPSAPVGAAASATPSVTAPSQPEVAPYDPAAPAGPATGLPRRVAWASTSDKEFFTDLATGIEAAARDRNLEYVTAQASGDPLRNVEQIETFLARGVGAVVVQPLDQVAQRPVLQRAVDGGIGVVGIITHPSVFQIAAAHYRYGYDSGLRAAA